MEWKIFLKISALNDETDNCDVVELFKFFGCCRAWLFKFEASKLL